MKEKMEHSAAEHPYLHKDFHGALSTGIDYLDRRFGHGAVREYLARFANAFYAPLKQQLRERGLIALKEHFEKLYAVEGGKWSMEYSEDELLLRVEECPAVSHMREHGYKVAALFYESSKAVHEAVCEGTPFAHQWIAYEPATGARTERFYRRTA